MLLSASIWRSVIELLPTAPSTRPTERPLLTWSVSWGCTASCLHKSHEDSPQYLTGPEAANRHHVQDASDAERDASTCGAESDGLTYSVSEAIDTIGKYDSMARGTQSGRLCYGKARNTDSGLSRVWAIPNGNTLLRWACVGLRCNGAHAGLLPCASGGAPPSSLILTKPGDTALCRHRDH